ncbi:MAG: quinone-dependent dihydroorotate dehydrogenase [Thermodesulfobacteriota bacterium]
MYKTLIRPILDKLDSETWHNIVREVLHITEETKITLKLVEFASCSGSKLVDERLNVNLSGIELENPLFVGAGWDKSGRAVNALSAMGFAGVEIGSVVEHRQPGSVKPRQVMLNAGVCLNWLGFNSPGMRKVGYNLRKYRNSGIPIGISLGINKFVKPEDAPRANAVVADYLNEDAYYFAINVSSPNTPGLRKLQDKTQLVDIVRAVNEVTEKPIFVKISPELTNHAVDDVIKVVLDNGIAGIIATNTTNNPKIKSKYGPEWKNHEGGISGDDGDYRMISTIKIEHIYKQAGEELEIIGVGGVKDTESALEKIRAGAKALQIVTGLRGEGPSIANNINYGLVKYMDDEGIKSISELVGS